MQFQGFGSIVPRYSFVSRPRNSFPATENNAIMAAALTVSSLAALLAHNVLHCGSQLLYTSNYLWNLPHLFSCIAIFPACNLDVLFLSFPLFVGGDIRSCQIMSSAVSMNNEFRVSGILIIGNIIMI